MSRAGLRACSTFINGTIAPVKINLKNAIALFIIIVVLVVVIYAISILSPKGVDWRIAYYPAARACLSGHSPYYKGSLLENPIWSCLLLAPFALFPEAISRAMFLVVSVAAYYAAFASVDVPRKWIFLLFLSPQILYGLNLGAIDPLILSAPAFPPVIGFVLALTKPQIGIGYAVFLLVEWIRARDFRSLFYALTLSGVGILLSFWLGMPFSGRLISAPWNTSLFPYSLPISAVLLFISLRNRDKGLSFIASPLASPYVGFYSWAVLYMLKKPKYILTVFILSWVVYFAWYFANV
jgi:hypothetical protein